MTLAGRHSRWLKAALIVLSLSGAIFTLSALWAPPSDSTSMQGFADPIALEQSREAQTLYGKLSLWAVPWIVWESLDCSSAEGSVQIFGGIPALDCSNSVQSALSCCLSAVDSWHARSTCVDGSRWQAGPLPSLNFRIMGDKSNADFAIVHSSDCVVMAGSTDKPSGNGIAANPDQEDSYCAVFSDPSECEQQRVKGVMKYWTNMEVRIELPGMHCDRRIYLTAARIVAHEDGTRWHL